MPVGGTDISGAITASLSAFDLKAASQKAIILITDGENTGKADPLEAAENARKAGVKLFCIGVGSHEGVPIPAETGGIKKDRSGNIILTRIDEETLKKMAVLTGGAYVRSVAGSMDLDLIYTKEIRGKMEASTLSTDKKQIWEDRFQWVACPGHHCPWGRIVCARCGSKKGRRIGDDVSVAVERAGSCRKSVEGRHRRL